VIATCNAGGATKWKPEHSAFLKDADVILVPDNDDAGWKHIDIVGRSLVGIAKRIRVLALPGLAVKGDIIDWAKAGTREQLDELIDKAPDWEPPAAEELNKEKKVVAEQSEDELLDALSKMRKGVEFDRERKRLAKQLDVRPSAIDAEIEERQAEAQTTALLHGHWYVEP
jgi:DNA primase